MRANVHYSSAGHDSSEHAQRRRKVEAFAYTARLTLDSILSKSGDEVKGLDAGRAPARAPLVRVVVSFFDALRMIGFASRSC